MKNIFTCTLLFLISVNLATASELVIHGETGDWKNHSIGRNPDDPSRFEEGSKAVAQALDAAKDGDVSKFLTIWNVNTTNPPAHVMDCYYEWKTNSQHYVYLIVEEAVVGDIPSTLVKQPLCAVSIAPAILRQPHSPALTNGTPIWAQVVFLKKILGEWKLVLEVLDKKVEQAMLVKASSALYQYNDYSPEGVAEQVRKINRDFLALMQKDGAPPERIAAQKENLQLQESGTQMKGWKDWTNYYHAVVLNPPIIFERRDAFAYNYSQPIAAFRSYSHAMFVGDGKALLTHADVSGQRFLKKMGVTTEGTNSVDLTSVMTHITVLLTATTVFDKKEYDLVFWRAQNETDVQHGPVALQSTIFVKEKDEYWLSEDLDDSFFGSLLGIVHVTGGFWKYADFIKELNNSEFPRWFYDIP